MTWKQCEWCHYAIEPENPEVNPPDDTGRFHQMCREQFDLGKDSMGVARMHNPPAPDQWFVIDTHGSVLAGPCTSKQEAEAERQVLIEWQRRHPIV